MNIWNLIKSFFVRLVPPPQTIKSGDPIILSREPVSYTFEQTPNITKVKNRTIRYVIVHSTVGEEGPSITSLWLKSPKSQASAHYIINRTGNVTQMVNEEDVAWHAGFGSWEGDKSINTHSIGVELVNKNDGKDPYPQIQLEVLMGLLVKICKKYRIPYLNVLRHADVDPKRKTDPQGIPWEKLRNDLMTHLRE